MTDAERRFRRGLSGIELAGTHFRRQVPIGPYVVDFACHGLKLIIEIDGGQHGQPETAASDRERANYLQDRGYRILRFWNDEIMQNLDGCLEIVAAAVAEAPPPPRRGRSERVCAPGGGEVASATSHAHPSPALRADPPRQGEGEACREQDDA